MRTTVKVAFGAAVTAAMISAPAQASGCANANIAVTGQDEAQARDAVVCLLNARRDEAGLDPLAVDDSLHAGASAYAAEMVAQHFFDHAAPDGSQPLDRVRLTGFLAGAASFKVGENIGAATGGSAATPRGIVSSWMKSPPHKANILDPSFTWVGVGAVPGTPSSAAGATYVADFVNRSHVSTRAVADTAAGATATTGPSGASGSATAPKPKWRRVRRCTRTVSHRGRAKVVSRRCTVRLVRVAHR